MDVRVISGIILFLALTLCESAKILYIMPFTSKSHYIGMKNLALELANKGHEVYAITPYKEKEHPPSYHQIMIECVSIWNNLFDERPNVFSIADVSFTQFQMLLYRSSFLVNELIFNSTEVQNFMKENHKIDLVINELFFNEAFYMFAHKYQAPLVLVTTFGNALKGNYFSRNPLQLSTLYHEYGRAVKPSSFIGRLQNLFMSAYDILMIKFWYFPKHEEYIKTFFKDLPEPVPSLEELSSSPSLVLMNSHFTIDTPAAYLPNFIEVGGLHITKANTALPKDLQKILDDAKDGAVFLSFGSNVHASELSEEKLAAFLKVFGELKQTVLMKWEDDSLLTLPKNVIIRKWFPQKDVVAHPNVKLFIGHGGFLGLQETIAAGVPILGIPVFGDQFLNILQTVNGGHGEILEYKDITEETLRTVINNMINDKRYITRAKEVATIFSDRPMPPIETAIWWIEYVIRHKGAEFMKTPALKMNFIEYNNLDIFFSLIAIIIGVVYLVSKFITALLKSFRNTRKPLHKKKKH